MARNNGNKHTPDYTVKMQDKSGRTTTLFINGADIDCAISDGYSEDEAREGAESNQFQNAIARGEIGDDAWSV